MFALAAITLLPGCLVGPDFRAPGAHTPDGWLGAGDQGGQTSVMRPTPAQIAQWWRTFKDPKLDSLIDRAVESNLDLRVATSRVRQARAARGIEVAGLLPNVNVSGSYDRARTRAGGSSDLYRAGFDAGWELDVFGGVRRSVEAADAQIDVVVEDRRDVLVTLTSEVATNYAELRGTQARIEIAKQNLATQRRSLALTRRRLEGGFVTGLDVANAEAQVASTESTIPTFEASARQSIYAIAVLLGLEPGALVEELTVVSPVPVTPPEVPVGLPSDLLRRRPDIRRAEAEAHVATARIGVATADLFPRFSLSGAFSLSASQLSGLGNWANRSWSVGPTVTWPIFEGGRIRSNIEVQNAAQEQTLIAYAGTILRALQEVESVLIAYAKEQQSRAATIRAAAANRRAVDLAERLYDQGKTDFLNVLNAQRSLFLSEDALVRSDVELARQLIATYKALGGGWEWELPPPGATTRPTP
ncbi:MAG TPA: efflux transporter outer membrane subunit [Tepidisphaeraceae bacterium]|nr:efflux transporter outer membrane subunit [Tepidisphaeraceae bacterium]